MSTNIFKISGDTMSYAINNYRNDSEKVKVLNWFSDFWVYSEIKFISDSTFISFSVFQGENTNERKHQLFRAEWDDYNNLEEKHPQPHWHITSDQAIEKTFEEFSEFDEVGFVDAMKEEKSKIADINKIHFAMNGNWINNESEIHSMNEEEKIVKWFLGLLSHIKFQLEYVS